MHLVALVAARTMLECVNVSVCCLYYPAVSVQFKHDCAKVVNFLRGYLSSRDERLSTTIGERRSVST